MNAPPPAPPRHRVLIADDHPLFRQGLRQTLQADPAYEIVAEAGDGAVALASIGELTPDLCILDINMPRLDGLAVVRQMRARRLASRVIILTMYKEEELFGAAVDLDVDGYVLKESAASDILDAVRAVASGGRYVSPTLAEFLLARRAGTRQLRDQKPGLERLTPSERRVLRMIAEDRTSKEIADELGLSPRTVENHRTNICAKLDVHGVHGLVKFAFEHKSHL